jgi:sugar phosphate isomerase/epimerase
VRVALNHTLVAGRVPWRDLAALAGRVGFDAIDVDFPGAMADGAGATRDLLGAHRLYPAAMRLPVEFRRGDAEFHRDLPGLDPAARFAAAIGCPRMTAWVPASGDAPPDQLRARLLGRLRAVAEVLAAHGVWLGLENLGPLHLRRKGAHQFLHRVGEVLGLARECGPNVGVLLDSWHWHHSGGTIDEIAQAADRIVHVHLADAAALPPDQVNDMERLMPGEGVADLAGFLRALATSGYRGAISPEVFGRGLGGMDPEEGARLGLRTTAEVMRCLSAS